MRRLFAKLAITPAVPAALVMFYGQPSIVHAEDKVVYVAVCVGQDKILRVTPFNSPCPPGTIRLVLSGEDEPDFTTCPFCKPKPPEPKDFSRELEDMERRVSELEAKHPGMEVVDSQKRTIFRISPRQAVIVNEGGSVVAGMAAGEGGGRFTAQSPGRGFEISLGVSGLNAGLSMKQGGKTRVAMGTQEKSPNYSLRILDENGLKAGIGESKAGTGALVTGDATGRTRASMILSDGKPAIGIYNTGGTGILSLTQSESRAGLLAIGDATGEPMVKMGVNGSYGVVLTGPKAGFPYVPSSGLPGSYILGCAATGSDCHPWH